MLIVGFEPNVIINIYTVKAIRPFCACAEESLQKNDLAIEDDEEVAGQ